MTSAVEQRVQRANTAAFVAANRVDLVLRRPTLVDNGAGGKRPGTPLALPPQAARLVLVTEPGRMILADGVEVTRAYTLVALPEMNIQIGDEFDYEGETYTIGSVWRVGGYEVKAAVENHGR